MSKLPSSFDDSGNVAPEFEAVHQVDVATLRVLSDPRCLHENVQTTPAEEFPGMLNVYCPDCGRGKFVARQP